MLGSITKGSVNKRQTNGGMLQKELDSHRRLKYLSFQFIPNFSIFNKIPFKYFGASMWNFYTKYSFSISISLLFLEVNMTVIYRQANDDTEGEQGNRWDMSMASTK